MNLIEHLLPTLLSALLGGIISGGMALVAIRVSIERLQTQRHGDAARIMRVEKKVGIDNGEPEFIRRNECVLQHTQTVALRSELKTDIESIRREIREDMEAVRDSLDELRLDFYGRKANNKGG